MLRIAKAIAFSSLSLGCLAEWKPADGVLDLDAIEQALHQVENSKLSPEQKKLSHRTVEDVERVVVQLKTDKTLSQGQRMQKVKGAIMELQGLQSQWQLADAEGALDKLVQLPHLSPEQRNAAKRVVADVEATVKDIDSGKLTGDAQHKKVGFAIKELQDLQQDWTKTATVSKVEALERELQTKKVLLKKGEAELKMAGLEKELLMKKALLKKLTAEKMQSEAAEKERKEDAHEHDMVSKLIATAKALAGSKASLTPAKTEVAASKVSPEAGISAILTDLQAREQKVAESIKRMDEAEKKKEAELDASIAADAKAPASARTPATEKGAKLMKTLRKQEHRTYLKARAARESTRKELEEGVRSVEKGDVAALTKLMAKMSGETKNMEARSKNFLY